MAKLGTRQLLLQILNLASFIAVPLMIYTGLGIVTNTTSPIVVVLSGSMEPAFYRGDILFLTKPHTEAYHTGDIVVYNVPGGDIPIVHRILETHNDDDHNKFTPSKSESKSEGLTGLPVQHPPTPRQLMLTKGDNNPLDDVELYRGLEWLERKHVVGKVQGFLPYVGYATILMNDFPRLKYILLGGLGLLSVFQRE